MFGIGMSWKIAKFEFEANNYFLSRYGFGVEIVGSFKLTEMSHNIYKDLERQNMLNSTDYILELEKQFRSLGYI